MIWSKLDDPGDDEERYTPLPTTRADELPANQDYPVVVLCESGCRCSIVNAHTDGFVFVHEDLDDVSAWSTTDIDDIEGEGWAAEVFRKYYQPYVRNEETEAKVNYLLF